MLAFAILKEYWKYGLALIVFLLCVLFYHHEVGIRDDLETAKAQVVQLTTEKKVLVDHLTNLADLSKEQMLKFDEAEVQRNLIMTDLSTKINRIKLQPIPKDCAGAVNYAVKNKSDLSWPK